MGDDCLGVEPERIEAIKKGPKSEKNLKGLKKIRTHWYDLSTWFFQKGGSNRSLKPRFRNWYVREEVEKLG